MPKSSNTLQSLNDIMPHVLSFQTFFYRATNRTHLLPIMKREQFFADGCCWWQMVVTCSTLIQEQNVGLHVGICIYRCCVSREREIIISTNMGGGGGGGAGAPHPWGQIVSEIHTALVRGSPREVNSDSTGQQCQRYSRIARNRVISS
jgi:hypothetical protein